MAYTYRFPSRLCTTAAWVSCLALGMASAVQAQQQPTRAPQKSPLQGQSSATQPAQKSSAAHLLILTGTAAYRERIAMPHDAVLTVQLQDISRADAPAQVVAQTQRTFGQQQVPLGFQLQVPRAAIDPRMRYAVRATVRVNGELRFATAQSYPVLTHGAPTSAQPLTLVMQAMPAAGQQPSQSMQKQDAPAAPEGADLQATRLQDTAWKLVALQGQPAPMLPGQDHEVRITLGSENRQVHGFTGCNAPLGGHYTLSGAGLQFDQLASTRKMCAPAANTVEREVLAALKATTTYRIQGEQLLLLGSGRVLARFEATYLR